MNVEQMKELALHTAALYAMLQQDLAGRTHDIDAHNLCSAVVEHGGVSYGTFFAYSNPSALPAQILRDYNFVIGDVDGKLINRGGMQDLHTEVRLINFLYAGGWMRSGAVISFFSSRTVCPTCRYAIMSVMQSLNGIVALMAYEYKVEEHGTITEHIYPIAQYQGGAQAQVNYQY